MTLKLNGSSSGSVSIDAPASTTGGADVTFKLPVADGTAGQVLTTDGSGNFAWVNPHNPTFGSVTSLGTGNTKDVFSGDSTNINKFEIFFVGLSLDANQDWTIYLGDSGGIESSGYTVSAGHYSNSNYGDTEWRTSGWDWESTNNAGFIQDGLFRLTRYNGNKWYGEGWMNKTADSDGTLYWVRGMKELSGALTTIRFGGNGSANFDAGSYKLVTYT